MTTFACGQCGASLAFDGVRTERCPYCASPNFVERPPAQGQPDPRFVVTFVGDAGAARRALHHWLGSRTMFADPALRHARVEELRGIYVPAYLYSAVGHTDYTAQIGENYTETETYTVRDRDGLRWKRPRAGLPPGLGWRPGNKTRTETRTVTRTEYRPIAGRHVGYVTDVVVSASSGLSSSELERIEPYELKQMRRFTPALVSGWITEEFARPLAECRQASHAEAVDQIGSKLRRFMPGDSYSDLAWKTVVSWESLDPLLVPVWMFAVRYRDDKPAIRVVVNGQTAKISGKVPLSPWRIALAILVLAAITAAIVIFARQR